MNTQPADSSEPEEQMICPSCHGPNDPAVRYCAHCHAPLDTGLMLDPMGQIQAEGFALRQATTGKPNLVVVIGIWLLFFPVLIAFGLIVAIEVKLGFSWSGTELVELAMPILIALFSTVLLYKTTANYLRRRKEANEKKA